MSAQLVNPSRLQVLLGGYSAGTADALLNLAYHRRAQDHRRRLSAAIQAVDGAAIGDKVKDGDLVVSRKVDGEFTLVAVEGDDAVTVNPGGTVRAGLPLLQELVAAVRGAGHQSAVLLGELYVHRTDQRPRVHDVVRVARRPDSDADLESLRLAVFDLIELDGTPLSGPYGAAFQQIEKLCGGGKFVHPVETHAVKTVAEVDALFQKWVREEGAEGLVVRSEEQGLFKIKPRHNLDVAVLGYTEGTEDREGMIHDLLIGVMRPEGLLQVMGRVGGGFTEDERRSWLSDLKDEAAESEYTEVNDQVAYQLVRPERVIEISCLDLVGQNTRGATVDRMVLDWDRGASIYHPVRRLPLCAPLSPQFVRQRDDKTVNPTDIRLRQVTDLIDVPLADVNAAELVLPKSEVLHRAVFTKVLKGQTLVRKLFLWKTNKEAIDPDYPAYVAYVTDFSPNREEAIKRDIRVSNSETQIRELYRQLSEQYVVRGWQAFG